MSQEVFETPGFSALLDLSFTRFVTISFIRVIYILWLVGIALGWLVVVIGAFAQGILVGLFAIVFGAVIAAVYALLVRMMLELVVVIFRIGENTTLLARSVGNVGAGGFPVIPTAASAAPPIATPAIPPSN